MGVGEVFGESIRFVDLGFGSRFGVGCVFVSSFGAGFSTVEGNSRAAIRFSGVRDQIRKLYFFPGFSKFAHAWEFVTRGYAICASWR